MSLIRSHSLKWLILALIFIVPLIPFYLINTNFYQMDEAYSSPVNDFQFYVGELQDGEWTRDDIQWETFNFNQHGRQKVTGTYWFRIQLPNNEWRDPHMTFYYAKNLDMYLGREHLYEWNSVRLSPYVLLVQNHLIELPDHFANEYLYFRTIFAHQDFYPGHFFIADKFNIMTQLVLTSDYRIVLGFVSLLIGIVGLLLYVRQRERSYLYFSLFALYIVVLCVTRSWMLFGLMIPFDWIPFFGNVYLAFGGYCFLRFFAEVFGEGPFRIHRRLWQTMLIVLAVMVASAFIAPTFHHHYMTIALENIIVPLMLVIVFITSIVTYRQKKDAESFWFMAGFTIFAVFSCLYLVLSGLLPTLRMHAPELAAFVNKNIELFYNNDRFLQAIFVLLFCMVMIVGERIRKVYWEAKETSEQLKIMSESLEQLVRERTAELEDTNVNLRASMHETSQALAEIAVLEERNRIARDMHDHVGHALTAALIQIEAAKLLIGNDEQEALAKLTASRESVSQGLESIRETVHKMKQAYEDDEFILSLRKLISDVEQSTGVVIEADIDLETKQEASLQPTLLSHTPAIKKMIYHALQEGLTNGIKHAAATRFEFSLRLADGDMISFRLANNGHTYTEAPFGFGLKAMQERITQLDGTLRISDHDGDGCMLAIDVPLETT